MATVRPPRGYGKLTGGDLMLGGPMGAAGYLKTGDPLLRKIFGRFAERIGRWGGSTRRPTIRGGPWTEEMLHEASNLGSAEYRAFSGGGMQRLRKESPFSRIHESARKRLRGTSLPDEAADFLDTFVRPSAEDLPAWLGEWSP